MSAVLITALNLLVAAALCVSIVRFWREGRMGARSVRRLAALSAGITLLLVLLIYSGELRRQALLSLHQLGAGSELVERAREVLGQIDELFTAIANAINDALGARRVGYRPDPPLWPAALLILGYAIRFIIYRFHTRNHNSEAALTGAV